MITEEQSATRDGLGHQGQSSVVAARAVLAAGGTCRLVAEDHTVCVQALDALTPEQLEAAVRRAGGAARLVLTGPRAQALGFPASMAATLAVPLPSGLDGKLLRALGEIPSAVMAPSFQPTLPTVPASKAECAGIELVKRAGLLPSVLALPDAAVHQLDITLSVAEVDGQRRRELSSLRPAVETRLPIAAVEDARLVVFRSPAGGSEQLALLIGEPERAAAPLCRLHSECLTGDLFGSLRCDCGEQLHGAIARMAEEGAGILLYLRQEGRGIGLVNKLRAYRLQDGGYDTVDANTHLGFQPDERDFAVAATMLQRLGFERVRLLTNNLDKLQALVSHGITVTERLPLAIAANRHNRFYLETKAQKSGHLLRVIPGGKPANLTNQDNRRADGQSGLSRALGVTRGRELGT